MLTGIAKIHFEEWYTKGLDKFGKELNLDLFYQKAYVERNAYMVEFFESVGIYIHATTVHPINVYGWAYNLCDKDDIKKDYTIFKTKQEAVKVMFDKANEIYNKRIASI